MRSGHGMWALTGRLTLAAGRRDSQEKKRAKKEGALLLRAELK